MPKLKPATQAARREHILDAAEQCFARSGFHRTTIQDICREADVSAGALYVYFASKEDLIAGICERDRAKFARELAALADAPDLLAALSKLGEHYVIEEPRYKRVLCIEMGAEATRNPAIAAIFGAVDRFVIDSFEKLFARAQTLGRIAPALDPKTLALVVALIGDGMFWRRAIDPTYDGKALMPAVVALLQPLINPIPAEATLKTDAPLLKALT